MAMVITQEKPIWTDHTILQSSKGLKEWKVQINQFGAFRCHCPSYIFSGKGGAIKSCKHIRHVMGLESSEVAANLAAVAAKIEAAAKTLPLKTAPVKHPQWDTALAMFDAMCASATKTVGFNMRSQIGVAACKAMIDTLAEKLQTHAPVPLQVMTETTVTVGVRRITFDD